MEPGPRPAGFRLLPPRRPHPEGGRLRHLPRARRQDAPDVEGVADDHAMVPGVPSQPRAPPPALRPDLQHGRATDDGGRECGPGRGREAGCEAGRHRKESGRPFLRDNQLLGVPPRSGPAWRGRTGATSGEVSKSWPRRPSSPSSCTGSSPGRPRNGSRGRADAGSSASWGRPWPWPASRDVA